MKRQILVLLAGLCSILSVSAGKVWESKKFMSGILNREVAYSVYLPDGYEESDRNYPVLYLLHGWTDDETAWVQMGNMQAIADRTIREGKSVPMIIVMPDAGESWYVNSFDGKVRYEDMFFQELIPYIEKTYKARRNREFRAVAGLSMGGYGSFLYTLHHPEVFSACAPLSAAVYTSERLEREKSLNNNRMGLFKKLYGEELLTAHWRKNSVIDLMQQLKPEEFPKTRYYIDCGDEDILLQGNFRIHEILQQHQIDHEFRVRDGGHTWEYWRTALPSVLEFVSRAFLRS